MYQDTFYSIERLAELREERLRLRAQRHGLAFDQRLSAPTAGARARKPRFATFRLSLRIPRIRSRLAAR